ncbi:hypothetical protein CHS0354_017819 [Potamilus streckersoni]|uniref:Uncharacterized protein n=1 Tax=Potamilus streckersoni TaxID=2493646 RepID=A0AAE0T9N5_9BIVA|nr:hypothetical protein CHS0354_017819 [Potamilus streckersoni]
MTVRETFLTKAFQDFEQADTNDVIEVLEDHKVRRIPRKENIHQTIMEIADKELIQEPMFVIDIWTHHLMKMGLTSAEIDTIQAKCKPTSKMVVCIVSFPSNMTESQKTISKYLFKFVTGSDIICTSKIAVTFGHLEGLSSRLWPMLVAVLFNCQKTNKAIQTSVDRDENSTVG